MSWSTVQIAACIDHTLLKPEATTAQIERLCAEARKYRFASVCVNPTHVRLAARLLRKSGVATCTVVGFPLGANAPEVKAYEAEVAIASRRAFERTRSRYQCRPPRPTMPHWTQ